MNGPEESCKDLINIPDEGYKLYENCNSENFIDINAKLALPRYETFTCSQSSNALREQYNDLKNEYVIYDIPNQQSNNETLSSFNKIKTIQEIMNIEVESVNKPQYLIHLTEEQEEIKQFLNIEVAWPYKESNKKQAMSIRQEWKDEINQLICNKNNKIFINSIEETHPEIANYYYQVIEFPMNLEHILEKIESYTYIGEIIKDLLLISRNCHKFNEHNNEIREMAYDFEEEILESVNQFLAHYESATHNLQKLELKSLDDLYYITLNLEFVPGKAPKILENEKNKVRNQERSDIDIVVYKLEMLRPETELYCLGSLLTELKSQDDHRQELDVKEESNNSVNIDLALLSKNTFWWFKELVYEQAIIEFGVEGDTEITEYLLNLQATSEQYVNIFKYEQPREE